MQKLHAPRIYSRGLIVLTLAALGACSSSPSEYSWSHLESGEYLFAYDSAACGTSAQGVEAGDRIPAQSVKSSPAFFTCMQNLGYFLVDPVTGKRLATAGDATVSLVGVTDTQAGR